MTFDFRPSIAELAGSIFLRRITRDNDAAARILERHAKADSLPHGVRVVDHHVWPAALPDVPHWQEQPPKKVGYFRWRMGPQWEEVTRGLDKRGVTWSHRFQQNVQAIRLGGEWFY